MSFTSTQPVPGLVHLDFDTFAHLGKALVRLQEYAESPKFQGQVFTSSRLKKYFKAFSCSIKKGRRANPYWSFTGFNIPGEAVDGFFQRFPAITTAEKEIQRHLLSLHLPDRYYIIASADGAIKKESWKAGEHELAHALWYLDSDYKAAQEATVAELPEALYTSVKNRLLSWGIYGPSVIEDEIHAYLATDSLSKLSQRFHWPELPPEIELCHNKLNARIKLALTK